MVGENQPKKGRKRAYVIQKQTGGPDCRQDFYLSRYESEDAYKKVATYINNKIAEFKKLTLNHQTKENKSILLELNIADDYFKAKKQVEMDWRRSFPRRTRKLRRYSSMS